MTKGLIKIKISSDDVETYYISTGHYAKEVVVPEDFLKRFQEAAEEFLEVQDILETYMKAMND